MQFKNLALIVAAGRGERFGGDVPKQYMLLGKETVLEHSISAFLNHKAIDAVAVVIAAGDTHYKHLGHPKLLPPITGGAERQDSVRLGLTALQKYSPKNILVHDAARPFVSAVVIDNVLAGLAQHRAVIPVVGVRDSARYNGEVVDRGQLKLVQTPQGFDFGVLLEAHNKNQKSKVTDDAAIVELAGVKIHMVEGDEMNKKITTPLDLRPLTLDLRVGNGFDVHEFETGTHVTICGIKIPHSHGLKGHSDADVGLHALVDALLGAIGAGDIGDHFPPSQAEWKNVDSAVFVRHAVELVKARNARINNVDITIICEEPKLTAYKLQMKQRVAALLEIAPDCVNIKATTTEKLGFTGRKEGIAAQAVAAVNF